MTSPLSFPTSRAVLCESLLPCISYPSLQSDCIVSLYLVLVVAAVMGYTSLFLPCLPSIGANVRLYSFT